jgi:hypothetical protein
MLQSSISSIVDVKICSEGGFKYIAKMPTFLFSMEGDIFSTPGSIQQK